MWKTRILAVILLLGAYGLGYFVYKTEIKNPSNNTTQITQSKYAFKLGLDLRGGTHLIYRADTSKLSKDQVRESMIALRDVIERRVNLFGVSEPVVQSEQAGFGNGNEERLLIDLPGITDVTKAVAMIGQTPLLEFKTENLHPVSPKISVGKDGKSVIDAKAIEDSKYQNTNLTGRYLDKAILEFDQNTNEPKVSLQFNADGAKLFEDITRANIGKTVAIYLDGTPISTPTVREAISGGKAVISGSFTPTEARALVGRLNSGALPVPIELVSTQTIGASLGSQAVHDGVRASMIGFILIALFLILWYRLPGLIAVLALSLYVSILLSIFKIIPVTLTAAGIAGFIISIGTAVDGNILIFERIKEEIKKGRSISDSVKAGFDRAWLSIRDSNTASIISGIILFWLGTSLMKGFALTLVIGMFISLFSAVAVSRIFLYALRINKSTKFTRFLFGSGFSNAKNNQNLIQ